MASVVHASLSTVAGQPSWRLAGDRVEACVTQAGGHLGPVIFHTAVGPVRPLAIAPWAKEAPRAGMPAVLRMLRGDFFCVPFGSNNTPWHGEHHPVHGETASRPWALRRLSAVAGGSDLTAELRPRVRPGRVVKHLGVRAGETNIYSRHELLGFRGPMCLGHHAMLAFPVKSGEGRIALSSWRCGRVCPQPFEDPARGGYSALKAGAPFRALNRVALADGGHADLSVYPARGGYDDLVMVSARPPRSTGVPLAWTAVTFPERRYVWFALKDPRVLASTILWHSNGGRHYPPWNGRHRRVLGLEEVTSYFHFGLAESATSNPLSRAGVPTVLKLRSDRVLRVNYVMGVAAVPRGFDTVRAVLFRRDHVVLRSASGRSVAHALDLDFFADAT